MSKVTIVAYDKRCRIKFRLYKLYYRFGFKTVFVCDLFCSGIDIAKYSASYKMRRPEVDIPVLHDSSGNIYYYHPKFHKWYKNLDTEQLEKYFNWLIPKLG